MEKKFLYRYLIILFVFLFSLKLNAQIINGADLLFSENPNLISGKKVGVVCNHTSLLADGTHLVDALLDQETVSVKSIFTPEHGFKGSAEAGELTIKIIFTKKFQSFHFMAKIKNLQRKILKILMF